MTLPVMFGGPFATEAAVQPDAVANLTCWLDADAEAFSDNDPVGTWTDQSGGLRHFTAAGAVRPTYKTGIVNGKAVIRFDGVDDDLDSDKGLEQFTTVSAGTVFAVFNVTTIDAGSDNGTNPHLNDPVWADVSGFQGMFFRLTGPTLQNLHYDGNNDITTHAISTGTWYYATQRHDSGNLISTVNGGDEQTTASGNRTGGGKVHAGKGQTDFFAGDIAEIIWYNAAVSAGDRAGIEVYLADKYAL